MLWTDKLGPIQETCERLKKPIPAFVLNKLSWTRDGEVGYSIHPGLPCNGERRKGPHENNGSCFKISRGAPGKNCYYLAVTCMDPECPNREKKKDSKGNSFQAAFVQWKGFFRV